MWAQVLADAKEAEAAGAKRPFYESDNEMAQTMMDFLFASQVSWGSCAGGALLTGTGRPAVLHHGSARLQPL